MGIEPTLAAWEAAVLPLNYTRPVLPGGRGYFVTRIFLTQPAPLPDSTFRKPFSSTPM